jgi:putative phosphoribosyl transferase
MPDRVLPARPDLEQYKRQAKELLKACAAAAPEALERIRQRHPRFLRLSDVAVQSAAFKLSDAQLIIAREHNFDTWPSFTAQVEAMRKARNASSDDAPGSDAILASIPIGEIRLEAEVTGAGNARGVVLFTNAGGSSRYHPGFRYMARELNRAALCTVLTDLFTGEEELDESNSEELRFDIKQLSRRTAALTDWIGEQPALRGLGLGYFASGNGAAAAMLAAGERSSAVRAVVSCAGRPDLAGPWLWRVQAPTLFVVGSQDSVALGFTQSIMAPLPHRTERKLAVIEGAHRLFEEQGALRKTAELTRRWFLQHLTV